MKSLPSGTAQHLSKPSSLYSSSYIDEHFGRGMNGIRERAWLRVISGHLNIDTLRMAKTSIEVDTQQKNVIIFETKVTPSMKNVVYSVYVIFSEDGQYIPKVSRCDCPNGWLFCSHTLACFLVFYLIQVKIDWTDEQFRSCLPVPIKSLQSVPFAAKLVFGQFTVSKPGVKSGSKKKRDAEDGFISNMASALAKEVPGYSGKYIINDDDATKENELMRDGIECEVENVKSINLCERILDWANKSDEESTKTSVTKTIIDDYNTSLVCNEYSNKQLLQKYLQHERLYQTMVNGHISKNKAIWSYLDHYASDRKRHIDRLSALSCKKRR